MVIVFAAVLTLQVRAWEFAELTQLRVLVVAMVINCEGSVMIMTVLRGTAAGEDRKAKLTGSY
jgi:hypothetical protein